MFGNFKKWYWYVILGAAILFFTIVLKDINQVEALKSLLRRKKVEDDVLKIKEVIAKTEGQVAATEEELVTLAEKHQEEIGKAKDASDAEIYDFYKKFLK